MMGWEVRGLMEGWASGRRGEMNPCEILGPEFSGQV